MKRILKLATLLAFAVPCFGQSYLPLQGYCMNGAQTVSLSGLDSITTVQQSIAGCTVTVYLTGTTTPATIYSSPAGSAKGNPFTGNPDASWLFFVQGGQGYDIVMSGGLAPNAYATPYTLTNVVPNSSTTFGKVDASLYYTTDPIAAINTAYTAAVTAGYHVIDATAIPTSSTATQLTALSHSSYPITLYKNPGAVWTFNNTAAGGGFNAAVNPGTNQCSVPIAYGSVIDDQGRNHLNGDFLMGASFDGTPSGEGNQATITGYQIVSSVLTVFTSTATNFVVGTTRAEMWGLTHANVNGIFGIVTAVSNTVPYSFSLPVVQNDSSGVVTDSGYARPMPYGMVCNADWTGGQQSWVLRDISVQGNNSAAHPAGPLIASVGTFISTDLDHIQTFHCNHDCLLLAPGSSQRIESDLFIRDPNLADQSSFDHPGCNLRIATGNGNSSGSAVANVTVDGGAIQNQGKNSPLFCYNARSTTNNNVAVHIKGAVDWEFSNVTAGNNWPDVTPIQIDGGVGQVEIDELAFSSTIANVAGAPTYPIEILASSTRGGVSSAWDIDLHHIRYNTSLTPSFTAAVHNAISGNDISGDLLAGAYYVISDYHYNGKGTTITDNSAFEPMASDPAAVRVGEEWFNSTLQRFRINDTSGVHSLAILSDLSNYLLPTGSDRLSGAGQFNAGTTVPTGWNNAGACAGGYTCTFALDAAVPPPGSTYTQSIAVSVNPGGGNNDQEIFSTATYTFNAGTQYTLGFYAKNDGTAGIGLVYRIYNGVTIYFTNQPGGQTLTSSLRYYTATFTPGSTITANVGIGWYGATAGVLGKMWFGGVTVLPTGTLSTGKIPYATGPFSLGDAPDANITTTVNSQACKLGAGCTVPLPAAYLAAGTAIAGYHIVADKCTLGTSCSVTLSGSAVFTGSTTYQCSATDETSAAAVKFSPSSGSAFALTGTGTDVLSYVCVGN